jgi:hypothetical protein
MIRPTIASGPDETSITIGRSSVAGGPSVAS